MGMPNRGSYLLRIINSPVGRSMVRFKELTPILCFQVIIWSLLTQGTISFWLQEAVCDGVDLGWLLDAHPAALSLLLPNRMGVENKMKEPIGWDEGREITYQLQVMGKTDLTWGKLNFIYCQIRHVSIDRNNDPLKQHLPPTCLFFPGSSSLLFSQLLIPPPCQTVQGGWGMGHCSQLLTLFTCSTIGPLYGLKSLIIMLQFGLSICCNSFREYQPSPARGPPCVLQWGYMLQHGHPQASGESLLLEHVFPLFLV